MRKDQKPQQKGTVRPPSPTTVSAAMAQLQTLEQQFVGAGGVHKQPETVIHTAAAAVERGCNAAVAVTAGTVRSEALRNAVAASGCRIGPTILLDAWHNNNSSTTTASTSREVVHTYHPANCSSKSDFEILYGPDLEHEDPAQYEWVTFTEPLSRAAAELDLEVVVTTRHIATSSSVPAGTVATLTLAYPLVAKQVFQSSIPLTLNPAKELVTCTPLAMLGWQEVKRLAAIRSQPTTLPPSPATATVPATATAPPAVTNTTTALTAPVALPPSPPPSPPSSSPELGRSTTLAAQSHNRSVPVVMAASWETAAAAAFAEVAAAAAAIEATATAQTTPTSTSTSASTATATAIKRASETTTTTTRGQRGRGRIRIVGAGPGGPELLTVAAARALAEADMVVSDRLVPKSITDLAKPGSTLFVAKKTPGRAAKAQAELDEAVLLAAAAGKDVVRLKGGDPFLFGRGGEEVCLYRSRGFSPELIPGISSCIAGPAAAMIPVTHRGVADKLMVVSAHGKAGSVPDLPLFMPSCTYVFMMGVGRLGGIAKLLISQQGFPASLPAAIVQEAWHAGHQRTVRASLNDIASEAELANIKAPAVIIVGEVTQEGLLAAAAMSAPATATTTTSAVEAGIEKRGCGFHVTEDKEEPCGTFQDDSFIV